jgi:uncharacterized membrane protein
VIVKASSSALKEGRWYEYLIRFVLGGMVSSRFGASVGGLFLALPAIFCASATLIEQHEQRRKREVGLDEQRGGQRAAALDAVGAALGSIGMLGFALIFPLLAERQAPIAFLAAAAGWCVISVSAWWSWRHVRLSTRSGTNLPRFL